MDRIFQMSDALRSRISQFSQRLDTLRAALEALEEYAFAEETADLAASLGRRADDLFREDRPFSIAVLGQVKSGKSTFLNSLLFDGAPVLPYARTPKTAALTRLEYAPESVLTVEYLSAGEWDALQRLAASPLDTPQVRAARETVSLVRDGGAALERLFALGSERIPLDGTEPGNLLNDYVGENGRFTPAVKCLTLGLHLDVLLHLSVVDTPGFYDPVLSRVERTRRCLETCDAAFYLSRAGSFLDRYDLELLTELIPLRGVGSLTLIASQMDSALADALPAYPGLAQALADMKSGLRAHAEKSLDRVLRGAATPVTAAVARCRKPVFLSAMAAQMAQKPPEAYNEQEQLIFRLLSLRGAPDTQDLKAIGNLEEAKHLFAHMAAEREGVLLQKLDTLLISSQSELALLLERIRSGAIRRRSALDRQRRALAARQEALSGQLRQVQSQISQAFEEYLAPLDGALTSVLLGLRRLRETWKEPPMREDFVLHAQVQTVSDTRLLLPWTWGKKHVECTKEKIPCTYLDPEDVRHSLSQLSSVAATLRETAFLRFHDFTALTDSLFAAGDCLSEKPEPAFLREAVKEVRAKLTPERRPAPTPFYLPASLHSPEDDKALRAAAYKAVGQITDTHERAVRREAARLQDGARQAQTALCDKLCGALRQEQDLLLDEQQALEAQAVRLQELLDLYGRSI